MKIKRIEPIAANLPMIKPVKMSFEEIRSANNTLVRLETREGFTGWGEAASAPTISADGDVEEARRRKAEGYVAFKIKVGVAEPLVDAERTRRVCEALGNGGILTCADANQGWSVAEAITYVRAVADTTIQFFE